MKGIIDVTMKCLHQNNLLIGPSLDIHFLDAILLIFYQLKQYQLSENIIGGHVSTLYPSLFPALNILTTVKRNPKTACSRLRN